MADSHIRVRGARAHNLKNVDVDIPKNKLVVITGLSGSGKSSLAFDTIYAEGQRRYVESLSSYARQFLGLMEKPDVDLIDGLSPAISIDQKSAGHNPRSTVGTITEIYDYLRLLYARVGHARSPVSGKRLKNQTVQEIVDAILALPHARKAPDVKVMLLAPLVKDRKGTYEELFQRYLAQGFVRARVDGQVFQLEEKIKLDRYVKHNIDLVVDRLVIPAVFKPASGGDADAARNEFRKRIADSVELALKHAEGEMLVNLVDQKEDVFFSEKLVDPATGQSFPEIEPHSFSFNSPHGACPACNGLGFIKEVDPRAVFDTELSIDEGGILPWASKFENSDSWNMQLLQQVSKQEGFSLATPIKKLSKKHLEIILNGTGDARYKIKWGAASGHTNTWHARFEGVIPSLKKRYEQTESEHIRRDLEAYMDDKPCATCKGYRLKPESLAVTIRGLNIMDVCTLSITKAFEWTRALQEEKPFGEPVESCLYLFYKFPKIHAAEDDLSESERVIAKQVFKEILSRLTFLVSVGLGYLNLSRTARTLSGGEAQRIRLASQIGTGLTGVLYVLDEPSIGLHQRDNDRLLRTLQNLRDLGNSVLVVEHDADTIRLADWVIDIGPGAGEHGGHVIFTGTPEELMASDNTDTGAYLGGRKRIDRASIQAGARNLVRRESKQGSLGNALRITGVSHNNLKNVETEIPLGKFVAVTGVSGSGKSSLVNDVLARVLAQKLHGARQKPGAYKSVLGLENLDKAIVIDQSPIGRTPRSNPATYTGLFTEIRNLFAMTPEAKVRGYKPGRFSFNVKGGRCENCEGDGLIRIEMQFLPDVYVTCEVCKGKRYNRDTLTVIYKGKSIAEVLDMTVEEAFDFFGSLPAIAGKLKTLLDVGLGYIKLGQSATTLSGGEAQRMKLSAELSRRATGRSFYILDEPSTGLHFEDVRRLLVVLHSLVAQGNTVLVIEHNLDIIRNADWIIDLGPEGGEEGGRILVEGPVEEVAAQPGSHTGEWLSKMLVEEAKRPAGRR